jgi:DNA-binding transcriptional regulator GbsR (MarR family)
VTEAATPDPTLAPSPPEELPPSAEEVYELLALEGPMTHRELVEYTEMPARTVRYAVRRLKEIDCLGERVNLKDCRQRFFFVKREESTESPSRRAAI